MSQGAKIPGALGVEEAPLLMSSSGEDSPRVLRRRVSVARSTWWGKNWLIIIACVADVDYHVSPCLPLQIKHETKQIEIVQGSPRGVRVSGKGFDLTYLPGFK